MTATAIVVASTLWTRGMDLSAGESLGALLLVEIVAWAFVTLIAGEFFSSIVFMFWLAANLVFTPWWLLGFLIGVMRRRDA